MSAYQTALDWLYSFIDSEKNLPRTSSEFKLARTKGLLTALGNPHTQYPSVVVAGTKGKGSTCAMLESMVRAAGLNTGLWTSPHLHSYRERMQINRVPPTQQRLISLVEEIKPAVAQLDPQLGQPSVYELGVTLGLLYFAQEQVDLAVLEIGIGGRLDAINVATPLLAVIASISYDHMAVLGDTLGAIAGEKAGIIKPFVPVITAVQAAEAADAIAQRATELQAPLFIAATAGVQEAASGALAEYPTLIIGDNVGLPGDFQLENARLAVGAGMLLRELGWPLTDDTIRQGLKTTHWPGRFELVGEHPPIVVDGAHNGASAQVLLRSLRALSYERLILVLGTSSDKDVEAMARELGPAIDHVVLTQSGHPRALPIEELQGRFAPWTNASITTAPDVQLAIHAARSLAQADDLICVAGSLFVVAAAREALGLAEAD